MGGYLYSSSSKSISESEPEIKNKFCLAEKKGALFELKKNSEDTNEHIEFKYIEKKQISHDTFIYIYEIPNGLPLGLNLGQHIAIDADINEESVSRKYTPVSHIFEEGKFSLLIKVYFKETHPMFPLGGKMSQYLHELPLEKPIKVRGPFGKLTYQGNGKFKILKKFKPLTYEGKQYTKVAMLSGGTGITPCYQILQAAHQNTDTTSFTLLFGNKTTKDILLQPELDEIHKAKSFNFNLHYLIDKEEPNWTGLVGYINKDMISSLFPAPSNDTLLLLCGPPLMCEKAKEIFKELNYSSENIYEF